MKIICAGLPKTGTTSLAVALRILGHNVYDYGEHNQYHTNEYLAALKLGKMPDFIAMYKNIDATTDFPACLFWEEIKQSFPDAKVILIERDNVETWVKSLQHHSVAWSSVIMSTIWLSLGMLMTPTGRKWKELDTYFGYCLHKPINKEQTKEDRMFQVYNDHNARVKAAIPRDELLVYNVKQGWRPLCEFLGAEVPDVPFPRLNVNDQAVPDMLKRSVVGKRVFNEMVLIVTIIVIAIALLIFIIIN